LKEFSLRPITASDGNAVIDIFNYYIENSYAAYPEHPVPYGFFSMFLEICRNYPSVIANDQNGTIAGFGMLRPHNPMPAFAHTAEITYFVRSDLTGNGLGSRMLAYLEVEGKNKGITTILASISGLNDGSIRFHKKHGFFECGKFNRVGKKNGVVFDTVWMQKFI
jgi:L-amino acid N-acyltransferase YncA